MYNHVKTHLAATDTPNNVLTRTLWCLTYIAVYIGVTVVALMTGKSRLVVAEQMAAKLED